MTAAHCLNDNSQPVDLYFNLLNSDNLNDPLAKKRTSSQIIIHENYNGATEEVRYSEDKCQVFQYHHF